MCSFLGADHDTRVSRAGRHLGALLVLFAIGAAPAGCNCNSGSATSAPKPRAQREQAPIATEGKPLPPPEPPPGTPLPGDTFRADIPATVAGFTATTPGEATSAPLANGGVLTKFKRSYKRDEQTLELELSDSLHAPLLPKVIEQQQGTEKKTASSELVGTTVGGQPAVLMFQSASRIATASVLLGSRVLLNVRINPADDLQTAVEVASALPLKALAAKVPQAAAAPALPADRDEAAAPTTAPASAAPRAAPSQR